MPEEKKEDHKFNSKREGGKKGAPILSRRKPVNAETREQISSERKKNPDWTKKGTYPYSAKKEGKK